LLVILVLVLNMVNSFYPVHGFRFNYKQDDNIVPVSYSSRESC